MLEGKTLSPADIERAAQFRIGDAVAVRQRPEKNWTYDWLHMNEAIVWGINVDRAGKINITILHDGNCETDGFEPEDLVALRASGAGGEMRDDKLADFLRQAEPTIARHGYEITLFCPDGTITDEIFEALIEVAAPADGGRS